MYLSTYTPISICMISINNPHLLSVPNIRLLPGATVPGHIRRCHSSPARWSGTPIRGRRSRPLRQRRPIQWPFQEAIDLRILRYLPIMFGPFFRAIQGMNSPMSPLWDDDSWFISGGWTPMGVHPTLHFFLTIDRSMNTWGFSKCMGLVKYHLSYLYLWLYSSINRQSIEYMSFVYMYVYGFIRHLWCLAHPRNRTILTPLQCFTWVDTLRIPLGSRIFQWWHQSQNGCDQTMVKLW